VIKKFSYIELVLTPLAALSIQAAEPDEHPPLTLEVAHRLLLKNNSSLQAARANIRVRVALRLQSGILPNPSLEAEAENVAGSGELSAFDSTEFTLLVSQPFELGGKRPARVEVAQTELQIALRDYESLRRLLIGQTTEAFYDVLAAQEQVAMADELIEMAEDVVDAARRRVQAGRASTLERARAAIERARSQTQLQNARNRLRTARARLGSLLGATDDASLKVTGDLYALQQPPSLTNLLSRLRSNPLWQRGADEITRGVAQKELQHARRIPNLEAAAGFRFEQAAEAHAFIFRFALPLPLFDRNQGRRAAAAAALRQIRAHTRAEQLSLVRQLTEAYGALSQAHTEAATLKEALLPAAQQAFTMSKEGYLQGRFSSLDLLDAERTVFEFQHQYINALSRYHSARAEVQRLTGLPE